MTVRRSGTIARLARMSQHSVTVLTSRIQRIAPRMNCGDERLDLLIERSKTQGHERNIAKPRYVQRMIAGALRDLEQRRRHFAGRAFRARRDRKQSWPFDFDEAPQFD